MTNKPSRLTYHVRHDLQPRLTQELLLLLWDKSPCSMDILHATATQRGYRLAARSPDQLIASLRNLELIERDGRGQIRLSEVGKSIAKAAKYQPELVPELIHLQYYTLYSDATQEYRFSWAYRSVSDKLWESEHSVVDPHRLIAVIQESAQFKFQDYDVHGVSFSQNSINGILNWFEALDPPCINKIRSGERLFARRAYCPPETILCALKYARLQFGHKQSTQLELSHEVRSLIARVCLLDEEALVDMLDVAAESFGLIYRRSERGEWITVHGDQAIIQLSHSFSN